MRLVVSNTGPLIHLSEAQALELLELTGEVHIPEGVDHEARRRVPAWSKPAWLAIDKLNEPHITEAVDWQQAGFLDFGEAEAIALTRQLKADWLLTDDAAARLLAKGLGIEVHGSLGIVLWAAAIGRLNHTDAESALKRLAESSLWLSTRVLKEAEAALEEMFRL